MILRYEVLAKIEAAGLDGQPKYTFHGGLSMEGAEGEPMQIAFSAQKAEWDDVVPGDVLTLFVAQHLDEDGNEKPCPVHADPMALA